MNRGRPVKGASLIDGLEGSDLAKLRLKVILETLAGERTIAQACEALGIGETAFYKLRERTLRDALGSLEPRARGRPRKDPEPAAQADAMQRQIDAMQMEMHAGRIREQIALIMPHLLKRDDEVDDVEDEQDESEGPSPLKKTKREIRRRRKQERQQKRRGRR
jgi:cytochrome P450